MVMSHPGRPSAHAPLQPVGRAWRLWRSLLHRLRHWLGAAGRPGPAHPAADLPTGEYPLVMVAVPCPEMPEAALQDLHQAVGRSLGLRPGVRLDVVTVVAPAACNSEEPAHRAAQRLRLQRVRLQQWVRPLDLHGHGVSYHVLEAADVAQALVRHAETHSVGLMILDASVHGPQHQHLVATVPMRVARDAPCSVLLVKPPLAAGPAHTHDNGPHEHPTVRRPHPPL